MKIEKKAKINKIINAMKDFSGAEVKAVATEAGYFAIRRNKTTIREKDFLDAIEKVKKEEKLEGGDYLHMFG